MPGGYLVNVEDMRARFPALDWSEDDHKELVTYLMTILGDDVNAGEYHSLPSGQSCAS